MMPLLTLRDMGLVRLVTQGFDYRRLAEMLHISEGTVKVHLHYVYANLGMKNRTVLALFAQAKGVI